MRGDLAEAVVQSEQALALFGQTGDQAAAEAAGDQVALGWTHATVGRYGTFTGAHDQDRAHLRDQAWPKNICQARAPRQDAHLPPPPI